MGRSDQRWWLARHPLVQTTVLLHVQDRRTAKGYCIPVSARRHAHAELLVLRRMVADIDAPRPQPQTYDPVDV